MGQIIDNSLNKFNFEIRYNNKPTSTNYQDLTIIHKQNLFKTSLSNPLIAKNIVNGFKTLVESVKNNTNLNVVCELSTNNNNNNDTDHSDDDDSDDDDSDDDYDSNLDKVIEITYQKESKISQYQKYREIVNICYCFGDSSLDFYIGIDDKMFKHHVINNFQATIVKIKDDHIMI